MNQHGDKKKERTTVMLSPEVREIVERFANADQRSMGFVVDKLLRDHFVQLGLLKEGQEE